MAITFHPKAGMVLMCDFRGYIFPEIVKTRPVVVVSPNHLIRPGLVTVIPLSTTDPDPVCEYHYQLQGNPIPGDSAPVVWAKCDLVATVTVARLDRIRISRGNFLTGNVSLKQVRAMRVAAAKSFGIEVKGA